MSENKDEISVLEAFGNAARATGVAVKAMARDVRKAIDWWDTVPLKKKMPLLAAFGVVSYAATYAGGTPSVGVGFASLGVGCLLSLASNEKNNHKKMGNGYANIASFSAGFFIPAFMLAAEPDYSQPVNVGQAPAERYEMVDID